MILAFYKPYGILSQFTPEDSSQFGTLQEFNFPPKVYPIGRLDADSEGLLLLSNESDWNNTLLHPRNHVTKTYWAQVEGQITEKACAMLRSGSIVVQGKPCLPAQATILQSAPSVPERIPPIRYRASIPTSWVEIKIAEGRNRQVRKMTAATGFPTLRLLRVAIGKFFVHDIQPGAWRQLSQAELPLLTQDKLNSKQATKPRQGNRFA
jgi:23S rRNA pseudouridine2457 synthase